MSLLRDQDWRLRYTPEHGTLLGQLYVPALRCTVSYDRTTGFFDARALSLAARGVEHLVANGGRMRLIIGCTLQEPEVEAIEKGQSIRDAVEAHLLANPLAAQDAESVDGLELLAWMVAQGILETRIALPCDENRRPVVGPGPLFHEKSGVFEDKTGDKLAFNGSANETAAGWSRNWESLNVFRSWREPERVHEEEASFARLWADKAATAITLDVPTAVRDDLLRFLPPGDTPPRRLPQSPSSPAAVETIPTSPVAEQAIDMDALRRQVWGYIREAPRLAEGGALVGEATAAVTPWPHQIRAFHRLYEQWPPRLLIADEVGLGKTIQAGLLLRQAMLAGRASRILVMAPASVCRQWQLELREKFNLNWPIYDGHKLAWQPSPLHPQGRELAVVREDWHRQPALIVSSHLLRRSDRVREVVEQAEPWDLVVLDEAHHARRRGFANLDDHRPNALLSLMQQLAPRTPGLVLLTATPMQVEPVEVWDLLRLLGLPSEWTARAFLDFFELVEHPNPSADAMERMAWLFRTMEAQFGHLDAQGLAVRLGNVSRLRLGRVLDALRAEASIPRRQLVPDDRRLAQQIARLNSPVARLISRHTRALLRRYHQQGLITTQIADRQVEDRFLEMSEGEATLYAELEDYITKSYNRAAQEDRSALGFVLTIYRRRLASSIRALIGTLERHLQAVRVDTASVCGLIASEEDREAIEADVPDVDLPEIEAAERMAMAQEEAGEIERLLALARQLPPDTKLEALRRDVMALRQEGYPQVMVFTQYTATMDLLREALSQDGQLRLMCFSGRGGEVSGQDGSWQRISRDETKRRFREGEADVLLCTDAAAEGLNFQFCGALINYDMPWNPMRVEQRIGRIDRLGQRFPEIKILNLHYDDTIEADVYRALGTRIDVFQSVVGKLQPILSRLPSLIANQVLAGGARGQEQRKVVSEQLQNEADAAQAQTFDLDEILDSDLVMPPRPEPAFDLDDLQRLLRTPSLHPPGMQVARLGELDWSFSLPGMRNPIRVTTDADFYEQHSGSVELWSPGGEVFVEPEWGEWAEVVGNPFASALFSGAVGNSGKTVFEG